VIALGIFVTIAAACCGVAFVRWCFSDAAAWIEPDPKPTALPRLYDVEGHDD
jgi:hypothetical protein